MASLGEKLRQERETRGVSLQEISEATRIHKNYLRAIEDDNFSIFPASVFVTGFLRNYAQHLGLDADRIVAEFETHAVDQPKETEPAPIVGDEDHRLSAVVVIGALVLLLIGYVAYVNWPADQHVKRVIEKPEVREAVPPPPVEKEEAPPPEKPEPVVAQTPQPQKTETPAQPEQKPAVEPVKTAVTDAKTPPPEKKPRKETAVRQSKYVLEVKAGKDDAWILVVVDDKQVHDMFVRAGQRIVIRANDSITFTTGNANSVRLFLNGKQLKFRQPANNVIRNWQIPLGG